MGPEASVGEADWATLVTRAILLTDDGDRHETVWFGCGWRLSEVLLDADHRDESGWWWGPGERLWWCTDGADSATVRAGTIFEAVAQLQEAGMPPRTVGKIGWSALR